MRAGLVKKQSALMYFKMAPFPLSKPEAGVRNGGCLSSIYYKNLVELLEVNLTILWWPPNGWSSLNFWLSDFSTISLQQFNNYSSGFPTRALILKVVFASESALVSQSLPYSLSLPSWGQWFGPVSSHLLQIQEQLFIFFPVCLAFYLLGWSGNF